ncbi:MAG TPA: hypothetical protein VKT21_04605, partial [Thermoplasmata archaeon]|nr:hypothetical protein [Thermoplasmata archaeon]
LADYLAGIGFTVDKTETAEPVATQLEGALVRMNPAVPDGLRKLRFRVAPTSGGAAIYWESPSTLPPAEAARADRFSRELETHLGRTVSTESHGTAKVVRSPVARLPWMPDTHSK